MRAAPTGDLALLQIENKIDNTRPQEGASPGEKFRHAELAARFWYLKGLYDGAEGRNLDALISYKNSIAAFPIRRPGPDRRDED